MERRYSPNDTEAVSRMAHNVASIASIPWCELADGPARGCLLEIAHAGLDVSAYVAIDDQWVIRLQGEIIPCRTWAAYFTS